MSKIYVVTIYERDAVTGERTTEVEKKAFTFIKGIFDYYPPEKLHISYDYLKTKIGQKGIHDSRYIRVEKIELIKGTRKKM